MVYLDNAATSYPKPDMVLEEMNRCMKYFCANPGRGGHEMSIKSGKAVTETREIVSGFFNIHNSLQLGFTKNATEALNAAIIGFLKDGDHVVTTSLEHNSVIRPLKTLERDNGVQLTIIKADKKGQVNIDDFRKSFKKNTSMVVCTISSNVNGIILPVKEIAKVAKENEAVFLLDASQGAGHVSIDVEDMNIDMLAFPGHKGLMGPQGTGGLYVREGLKIKPMMQGGTGSMSENVYQPDIMPDMLESGTLNTPGIIGLGFGVRFINSFGLDNLRLYKQMLTKRLIDGISCIKGLSIYSPDEMEYNSGIAAVNIEGCESTEVSDILDREYGIATRAGLHCSPLAHETLGTTRKGVVRFSVGCFNSIDEIDYTLNALEKISADILKQTP